MWGKLNSNNKFQWYSGEPLIVDGNICITNREETYNKCGWYKVEVLNEAGTDHVENNILYHYIGSPRTLAIAKNEKLKQIDDYDTSSSVNEFDYLGQKLWIDKATRVGLVNAINSAKLIGEQNITFGIQGISVTLSCDSAELMMAQLEWYALQCYNVTLQHKNNVEGLTSVEEVDSYDHTAGYPDKLKFM